MAGDARFDDSSDDAGTPVTEPVEEGPRSSEEAEADKHLTVSDDLRPRIGRKFSEDRKASLEATPEPDPDFYKTLAKALVDIAEGLEQVGKRRD